MIETIEQLIDYLSVSQDVVDRTPVITTPIRECEFILDITNSKGISVEQILTSFTIPDFGVKLNQDAQLAHFPVPTATASNLNVSYMVVPSDNGSLTKGIRGLKGVHSIYYDQFENGLLKITKQKPTVTIKVKTRETPINVETLMIFTGCTLSYPKPSVSLESSRFSKFNIDITYKDVIIP